MGTKVGPAQLRPPAGVQQWRARQARRAARACPVPRRGPEFRWPADRDAIVAEVLAASGRGREGGGW
jgi:hypothetical protein